MEQKLYNTPPEILEVIIQKGITKAQLPAWKQLILGFLAGAFIAFAASSSNVAAFGLLAKPETYGLGKVVAGLIFPVGLMFVVLAGSELFTGNILLIVGKLEKRFTLRQMLQNWILVYIGNFLGALLIVFFIILSGQLQSGEALLGGVTIKIAYGKVSLSFLQAFILGVMCNWIVCLAVWMCFGANDFSGRILAAFFPILMFVVAGFEHSIANMYYIPAGILAKASPQFAAASKISPELLQNLNWVTFFTKNLIPVTIGNIIGGAVFVGLIYWLCYKKADT